MLALTMRARVSILAAVACVAACRAAPATRDTPSAPASVAQRNSSGASAAPTVELEYVVRMTGSARLGDRVPLIVALHGLGDRPESFVEVFEGFGVPARVILPHSETRYSSGYSWFEFRRSDPDFSAPGIAKAANRIAAFAKDVAQRQPTAGRPIVVGFSQGGALSFALAALHADVFAAAFPVGGWFPAALLPARKPETAPRIVAFHGRDDPMVPIARMRAGAARLSELGFSVDVREFQGLGHSIREDERLALFDAMAKACEREQKAP